MTVALIGEIVALILQLGPLSLNLIGKLEPLLNIGPSDKQNIANAIAAAQGADAEVLARTTAWMKANGFVPVTTFVLASTLTHGA